nr:MAG TPA: Putative Head Tail Connector Protein [Caudoviricetes sp.]
MLEVGKNTYVTIEEADEYIAENYSEKNILRAHWTVCPDEYKEQYLRKSMIEIEALPFVGRKTIWSSELQFPRTLLNAPLYVMHNPIYLMYNRDETKVPKEVKEAEIENALGIIQKSYRPTSKAAVLSALGLVPVFSDGTGVLSSEKAERLLKPFLGAIKA